MSTQVLRGSRAQLDGAVSAAGLEAESLILRDAMGVVSIRARSRRDIAYSLGFVHAQERFFQMDLLRRNAAGELSELFGKVALDFDKKIRLHQFRKRANLAFKQLSPAHQSLLAAYTRGVNTGLAALQNSPFEYYLLRAAARPWHEADTFLVVYSMYMDLQDEFAVAERSLSAMQAALPQDWLDFLAPLGGEWDAPLPLAGHALTFNAPMPQRPLASFQTDTAQESAASHHSPMDIGSNNWAVSGALTEHGAALIADDMHLGLNMPNIWFRASWQLPENGRQITGVTLPGAPLMIVGSTEKIAWGFTNAFVDSSDVIRLTGDADNTHYLTEQGWQAYVVEREIIQVKGAAPVAQDVSLTQWGPVIAEEPGGARLALRWVAHEPAAANVDLIALERAESVQQAVAVAANTGIPAQNIVVGDTEGNIGWTIMGYLPQRFGYPSIAAQRLIADWSRGDQGWRGKLPDALYPKLINPDNQRLWSANARMVKGEHYRQIGDGFSALGARQQQIRDQLVQRPRFDETAFLRIQLDNRALFLQRWHQLLTELIQRPALRQHKQLEALRRALPQWRARADADSAGYFLVKKFREAVIHGSVDHVLNYVGAENKHFSKHSVSNKIEYAVWRLISEQPAAHVPAGFGDWQDFLQSTALSIADTYPDPPTWGEVNQVSIQHPLSRALPLLGYWLDMETVPLPGDSYMPRVQGRRFGASQRMAVAPGQEARGYLHMPAGQSSHPLSPFFGKGHDAWLEGKPSAFLPGASRYRLQLLPN